MPHEKSWITTDVTGMILQHSHISQYLVCLVKSKFQFSQDVCNKWCLSRCHRRI